MRLRREDVLAALGGRTVHAEHLPEVWTIATDTRAIAPGDVFLALRGERFDGHEFIGDALTKHAAAAIVSEPNAVRDGLPAVVVTDTREAYLALAALARSMYRGRVIAITGSAGKTTTKSLLGQLLRSTHDGEVAISQANENNEIGLSKLLLGMPENTDCVVAEFGARHASDIPLLVRVARPDTAILTNIGDAHIEIMGSRENVATTKFSIFSAGAQPVLNAADSDSRVRSATLECPPRWFAALAERPAHAVVEHETLLIGNDRLVVRDSHSETELSVEQHLPGAHNRENLAAAIAGALALGASLPRIAAALSSLVLPAGRYERSEIGGIDVIFDAYNASASGTIATLRSFAEEPARRRIAVLSSMAELGAHAAPLHENVGAFVARSGIDVLLAGGAHATDLERGARAAGLRDVSLFERNDEAVRWLRENTRAGDLVLLKGSRMYKLEQIVESLRA